MNKNKGFIGIGLILAIVLGIVVVGGGAYYLGNNKGENKEVVKTEEKNLLKNTEINQNQNLPNVSDKSTNKIVTVLSPNGGEVYKDTDKIAIKWKGVGKERISISLRFFDGGWCGIEDVSSNTNSYVFTPYGNDCGNGRIINSGQYKVTVIAYDYGGMSPEPGTAFAGDYSDNNGSDTGFSIDSSDNYFTINSEKYQNSPELFSSNITCNKDNPNYFVVSKSQSEPGTDILIKYRNSNKNVFCDYKVDETDFEIKNNGNAQYFYTINKNLLILDSGTGPDNRGIIIYNLDTRKKVFEGEYYAGDGSGSNLIINTETNIMKYWSIDFNIKPTIKNCPQFYNSNGAIVSHISLDLSTLVKKDLGENKCVYQQ